jgi:hypothetical protein
MLAFLCKLNIMKPEMIDHIEQDLRDRLTQEKKRWESGAYLGVALVILLTVVSCTAAAPADTPASPTPNVPVDTPTSPTEGGPWSYVLPTEDGAWTPPASHVGEMPTGTGTVRIKDVGEFDFDASQVETLRPDIFQPGHFSLFDILIHLARQGDIALETHFDESMDTHVIDAINGQGGWWYEAHYSGGWSENNVFRMDMYPYKNGTQIRLYKEREEHLTNIYRTFQEEVARLAGNGGQVIIPEVTTRSPRGSWTFRDVAVTAHSVRSDMLQPSVVTALDALLSLAEQGELSQLKLTWYERIGTADPVDTYYLEQIDEAEAYDSCGFVYETGPRDFSGFTGSHIHIPSDVRVTVSPEYALWFWICL